MFSSANDERYLPTVKYIQRFLIRDDVVLLLDQHDVERRKLNSISIPNTTDVIENIDQHQHKQYIYNNLEISSLEKAYDGWNHCLEDDEDEFEYNSNNNEKTNIKDKSESELLGDNDDEDELSTMLGDMTTEFANMIDSFSTTSADVNNYTNARNAIHNSNMHPSSPCSHDVPQFIEFPDDIEHLLRQK